MRDATLQDYRERVLRVLVFIQENLDAELGLEQLAALATFSPYHFHRIFRGMTGESLHGHIRRIRLERAAHRLRFSDEGILTIALEAGYESHEAFSRAFRSLMGRTPSGYRDQQQSVEPPPTPAGVHYCPPGGLREFHALDSGGADMNVAIRNLPAQKVAFMRHIGPYDQCGETWNRFCPVIGSQGLIGPGVLMMGLCHDDPEITPPEKVRYDCCVTVDEEFEPAGEVGVQVIAAGDYAVTTHHGPYNQLGKTYAALMGQWLPRSGRMVRTGPSFEVYLNDPESTEPDELLTDVYVPLEQSTGGFR